jgi:putative membrane protein
MFVAYPLLALDRIGVELQNPFATSNLSHLPLDSISAGIARNLHDLLKVRQSLSVDVR